MAEIIPFPQSRNIGKARHVAERWLQKSGRVQESYWTSVIGGMAGVMVRIGFPDDVIARETEAFRRAVQAEIDRRQASLPNRNPPGAA